MVISNETFERYRIEQHILKIKNAKKFLTENGYIVIRKQEKNNDKQN